MTDPTLTPSRLWKRTTAEQRTRIAHAFWSDDDAIDDQLQAALLIAQQKKFRPKTVIGLDIDRKAKHLASLATVPDQVAGRALILYHLADQRAMMGRFLDALGVAHENGVIQEDDVKPDPAKMAPADCAGVSGRRRQTVLEHAALPGSRDVGRAQGSAPSQLRIEEFGIKNASSRCHVAWP